MIAPEQDAARVSLDAAAYSNDAPDVGSPTGDAGSEGPREFDVDADAGSADARSLEGETGVEDGGGRSADGDAMTEDDGDSAGIDGGVTTTATILDVQSTDCLPCAARSGCLDPALQGGTCETTSGMAPAACGPLLGSTGAVSETEVCLAALNAIFTSGCAATSQGETPCLCGDADSTMCLAGTATPAGPLAAFYDCDLEPADIDALVFRFTDQASGAGQANALVQCLSAFSCDCFGM